MAIKELEKKSYFNKLPIRMIVISIVLVGIVTSALIISKPKSNLEEAEIIMKVVIKNKSQKIIEEQLMILQNLFNLSLIAENSIRVVVAQSKN